MEFEPYSPTKRFCDNTLKADWINLANWALSHLSENDVELLFDCYFNKSISKKQKSIAWTSQFDQDPIKNPNFEFDTSKPS